MGAFVTCVDINQAGLKDTIKFIPKNQGQAVTADVTKYSDMEAVAKQAIQKYRKIDVILNNAGIMPLAFFLITPRP